MTIRRKLDYAIRALQTARRYGKTYQGVEMCRRLEGTYLCATAAHEHYIKSQYPYVRTAVLGNNLLGQQGPFVPDHFSVERLLAEADEKIEQLGRELVKLKEAKDD